jgi:hypothetical protein
MMIIYDGTIVIYLSYKLILAQSDRVKVLKMSIRIPGN